MAGPADSPGPAGTRGAGPGPTGELRLSFPCQGAELAQARACEQAVFGWHYGNAPGELDREYAPYAESTVFGAVLDAQGAAVASLRLIRPGRAGLKTLHDLAGDPWCLDAQASARAAGLDPAGTWDVTTIGVHPALAPAVRTRATMAIYHLLVQALLGNDVEHVVAVLDRRARRLMASIGWQLYDLPGAAPATYLGSPQSTPVWSHVRDALALQAQTHPKVHPIVVRGEGLDVAEVHPLSRYRLSDLPDPGLPAWPVRSRVIDLTALQAGTPGRA